MLENQRDCHTQRMRRLENSSAQRLSRQRGVGDADVVSDEHLRQWRQRRTAGVVRLVGTDSNLGVPRSVQGALVVVRASQQHVLVVHDHHLPQSLTSVTSKGILPSIVTT